MIEAAVSIPNNLTYQSPEQVIPMKKDLVEFRPISGENFAPGNTCSINISSSDSFIDFSRSYLKYDVKLTSSSNADAANFSSRSSLAGVIGSVKTTVGGVEVERIDRYNNHCSIQQARFPYSYKRTLQRLEALADTTCLSGSANKITYGRRCCHALRTGIFESERALCLPYIRGGCSVEITFANLAEFLASNANSSCTDFTVSNVRLVGCMTTPSESYMESFNSSLADGRVVKIPLTITKSYRYTPSSNVEQNRVLNVGFLKSLNDISVTHRTTSALTSSASDSFLHVNAGLKSYSLKVGAERYPKNFEISTQNVITSGTVSSEALMQQLLMVDNSWGGMDTAVSEENNTDHIQYYDFRTNQLKFGTGVPVSDGVLELSTVYNSSPADFTVDVYVRADAMLEISSSSVSLNSRSF